MVRLKFRDEDNIGFPYGYAFVILSIQLLRPLRNSRFQNNIAQSWQVNSMNAI